MRDPAEEEDMRSPWVAIVLGLTLVAAASVAPAAFGLVGKRDATITLALRPPVTAPHRSITAYGTVSTGEANAKVTVQFKQCGLYPTQFRDATEVVTKEGGKWSASIVPEANGTFRATRGPNVSNEVRVQRRADVRLVLTRPGRYRAASSTRSRFGASEFGSNATTGADPGGCRCAR
jgi:hypothetical protein